VHADKTCLLRARLHGAIERTPYGHLHIGLALSGSSAAASLETLFRMTCCAAALRCTGWLEDERSADTCPRPAGGPGRAVLADPGPCLLLLNRARRGGAYKAVPCEMPAAWQSLLLLDDLVVVVVVCVVRCVWVVRVRVREGSPLPFTREKTGPRGGRRKSNCFTPCTASIDAPHASILLHCSAHNKQ
jgi:hypothetical protein